MLSRIFGSYAMRFGLVSYGAYHIFLKPAFNLGGGVYNHFFRPRLDFQQRYGEKSWVVITGASSGIGEAYAQEFAQSGLNLILVGRSKERLEITKSNLKKKYPNINIDIRAFDLTSTNLNDFQGLSQSFKDQDVAILVNNAGIKSDKKLEEDSLENLQKVINTNTGGYVYLTSYLIRQLQKRQKRSAIVFTCQDQNVLSERGSATYQASKYFDTIFAESLAWENTENIDTLVVKPGKVSTSMFEDPPKGFEIISAQELAKSAVDKLGYEKVITGSWKHELKDFKDKVVGNVVFLIPQVVKDSQPYKEMVHKLEEINK